MKLYNADNIEELTLDQVQERIDEIENDADMISAEMADRLIGDEYREYNHNRNILYLLYGKKGELRRQTKEYWYEVINTQAKYIAHWSEELANNPTTYKKITLTRDIKEAEEVIQKAINTLAEM
jgi:hypothetical protein